MRRFILVFLGTILLANVVAWFAVDSILGRLIAPEFLRWGVGVFILFQIAGMVGIVGGRFLGHQPGTGMGRPILSLVMIWNMLLALPTAVLASIWLVTWSVAGGPT